MRIAVIVPTTAGPRIVTSIKHRKALPHSQMVTDADYRPIEEISERYHDLVSATGPLREVFDLEEGAFQIRLDDKIDSGRSWELPVAIAHWVTTKGHDIVASDADLVIWATGAFDSELNIRPDNYHLSNKLALSTGLLEQFRGENAQIVLLEPYHPDHEPPDLLLPGEGQVVQSLQAAIAGLEPLLEPAGESRKDTSKHRNVSVGLLAGPTAILFAFAMFYLFAPLQPIMDWINTAIMTPAQKDPAAGKVIPQPEVTTTRPPKELVPKVPKPVTSSIKPVKPKPKVLAVTEKIEEPLLRLIEYRAPHGSNCIHFLLKQVVPVTHELQADAGIFPTSNNSGLCAIGLDSGDSNEPLTITLDPRFLPLVMQSDRKRSLILHPGSTKVLRLIQPVGKDLNYVFQVKSGADHANSEFKHRFASQR